MNKENVWFITTKTNLHVGIENTYSYGLIDLAIQRNVTTGLPCINSSSLKGALNEYASKELQLTEKQLIDIFGCDKLGRDKNTQKGNYTFFDANILFLSKQCDNQLYELVTCDAVLKRFFKQVELIAGEKLTEQNLANFVYKKISEKEFIDLCSDDNLPIIARNVLDNGESKNLWYEQVLPAETVLYTVIDGRNDNTFGKAINDKIVQIGAGATIGYGYCKFTNLK